MFKSKTIFKIFLAIVLALPLSMVLVACKDGHKYSEEWTASATEHWHACNESNCDEVIDKAEHIVSDWIVDVEPSCEKNGTRHKECIICHYVIESEQLLAFGHDYDTTISSYEWKENYTKCLATRPCAHDSSHKIEETAILGAESGAKIEKTITQEKTCLLDEISTFEAIFENIDFFTNQVVEGIITADKLGHNYVNHVCSVCGEVDSEAVAIIGEGTNAVGFSSLAVAVSSAQNDDVIKLLKDITLENYILIDKDLTFDFGGNTVTSEAGVFDVANNRENSKLILKNGKMQTRQWGVWLQNGAYLKVENDFEICSNINREYDSKPAVVVTQGSTAEIYGTLTAVGESSALSGNGSSNMGNVTINIYDGAKLSSENVTVYMPNTNALNISGGEIIGKTAVYIKCGVVNITGGTFITRLPDEEKLAGKSLKADYAYYNNGCYPTGDAIVLDACGYPAGDPSLTIEDGVVFEEIEDGCHAVGYYKYNGNEAELVNVSAEVDIGEIVVSAS